MLKSINAFRRKLTKSFTKYVGTNKYLSSKEPNTIQKVLIVRPNHRLGNILLITPLIEEVTQQFPNATIDLFVKGGASYPIFENNPKIGTILSLPKKHFKQLFTYIKTWFTLITKSYDLVINTNIGSSSGRLATKFSKAKFKFYGEEKKNPFRSFPDYYHFSKFPVYNFRAYLLQSNPDLIFDEIPTLSLHLTEEEKANGKKILDSITQNSTKKTIAFFTFATGAKRYSKEYWNELYQKLQENFEPEYNLVEVLPVENVSQIDFKAKHYYSKDIREIVAFLSHTEIFIGADSGMMHLATTATKTLGLFSVTKPGMYSPYGEGRMGINTNTTSIEECIEIIKNELK